ncbi:PP2C family protein-serine/threonine phosphatase [Streptomyces bacillaris]|uniref:PP2C family protein-serine/threonine phosphatase n=1 Tax=Streptomyces rhizosphaericola TaxID=2564098 RepID=UPI0039EFE168
MVRQRRAQWIPVGVIALSVVIDLATPTDVTSAPLLATAPVAAAPLLSPAGIVAIGVLSMIVQVILARVDHTFGWYGGVADQLTLVAVTVLAVLINRTLTGQSARTRRARQVAAVAQAAVLPRPPSRLGDLAIAACYVPAEDEAMIGGDLYVVQDTPHGVRVMVGDVRGKGLGAVSAVCADLGAFRYAADEAEDLPRLVNALEWALLREGARRGGQEEDEGFTTALIAEFAAGLDTVRIVNRGHPPPLLLDAQGGAVVLGPSYEAPPLGMGDLGTWRAPVDTFAFPPGSTLLCYTDGVTEARDENGVFYDAAVRLPHLLRHRSLVGDPPAPAQILQLLIDDVGRHTGGRVQDDQALLALHRPAGATGPVLRPPRV